MRLEKQEPMGGAVLKSIWNDDKSESIVKQFKTTSSSFPFGQPIAFSSIGGPTYVTVQTLIQQVAYSLSDKLYTYSPETFDLDASIRDWAASNTANAYGYTTSISLLQTRTGAGSIALGYMFSKDFDLSKRHIPQSLLASTASLKHLHQALDQLSLLYSVANPFVAHIAAVDYTAGSSSGLVSDYVSALIVAEELGLGLVSSASAFEVQHMALFSTLVAKFLPTIHIYDATMVGRETFRIIDVMSQTRLENAFTRVSKDIANISKKVSVDDRVNQLLMLFNNELGTSYSLFEYHGHESPETVLVVFGTVESFLANKVALRLAQEGSKVGVVNVRVYRPFVEEAFLAALPNSIRKVLVLGQVHNQQAVTDQSVHSNLYTDVLAALTFANKWAHAPAVMDVKYAREMSFTPTSIGKILQQSVSNSAGTQDRMQILDTHFIGQYTFWDLDDSPSASAPAAIGKLLSSESATNISLNQVHDNFVQGGTTRTDVRASKKSTEAAYPIEDADVVVVGEEKLLKDISIIQNIKFGGKLMLKIPGVKDEDLEERLSIMVRKDIATRNIKLYILDPTCSKVIEKDQTSELLLVELAFLQIARPELLNGDIEKLAAINGSAKTLKEVSADLEKALRQFTIPKEWADLETDVDISGLPMTINSSSFTKFDKEEVEPRASLRNWQAAAKGLVFKEAYGTQSALRPDLSVKTFTIHVKENRRLTPLTYDRNIFHIEFGIGTSGLKYDIGEALGIHAENNEEEVLDFIKFYGLNSEEVVEVPSRDDFNVLETRTIFQSLMQNIDIFGKPPKRFYEALAEFASDDKERKELLTLGGTEGANEFKRRAEVDTVTYADILLEFTSAHPRFHDIVRIVNPMKRREYSIASSQKVDPTTIALMIVVVGWVDPKGRDRFGQATRYLSKLAIGTPVTVSVKPSVMKLPVKDTAPLIMAGLGTGLAPFRAFVQYRAMQKAQGKDIGSILLYMGSRHQREEYLYGEEWEAYQDAGVITLLGRAFSRDQPQKIYIQDRMRQTMSQIIEAYIKEEGSFYLCGPTWPVPDVTEVLQEAIARHAQLQGKRVDPRKEIERLKDELRYVLEVY